jgi:hypothetical protein
MIFEPAFFRVKTGEQGRSAAWVEKVLDARHSRTFEPVAKEICDPRRD